MIPETRLPPSWEECRLGDVVDYGTTQKAEPYEISADAWVLELEDIEKDTSKVLQRVTFAQRQSKSTKNRFAIGDVLYGKLRPYLNKVVRADQIGYCTTEIVPLRPSEAIDGSYLFYWLKHPVFLEYVTSASHGLSMPRLGTEAGKEAPLVLAPLNEQKRIAEKLDAVFTQVDACRDRLDRVPAILKRFRQAVLAAAASGKLTEEWREKHDDRLTSQGSGSSSHEALPPGWWWSCPEEIKASERYSLAIGPFGSHLKVKDYRPTGVPLVFVKEIRTRNFGGPGTKFVSEEKAAELATHTVAGGDLLITKMGDPPGDTALYPKDAPNAIITADCIKLRVNELVAHPMFVGLVIESPQFRKRLQEITAGIAQQKISLERFRRFPLQLAPIAEQHEIVRRVETMFAYAYRLEARYTAARAQVERLAPTLLAKAFRGELVPQDPNDEPASVLLERIRAARAEQPIAKRGRKPPVVRVPRAFKEKAAMTKSRYDDDVQHKPYLACLLREAGGIASVEDLFRRAELPVTDFYKQLVWEVENGHIRDDETRLEAA